MATAAALPAPPADPADPAVGLLTAGRQVQKRWLGETDEDPD
jgi:hypothetical protein